MTANSTKDIDQGVPPGDRTGLTFSPHFTTPGAHPYDVIKWECRDAAIYNESGDVIFKQEGVEVPSNWGQLATDIAASKYFRRAGVPQTGSQETCPESSVRELITRVARTLRRAGEDFGGYFASPQDAETFEMELTEILVTQRGAFNSPVWFNCGLWHEYGIEGSGGNWHWDAETQKVRKTKNAYEYPQNSACFIQNVDDSLDSMLELQKSEVRLFKHGSGTGTNFSKVRAKGEPLTTGGVSSGVLSFLEGFDTWAGRIKSGGTTRRAAKMVILDMEHPEIVDYIDWKLKEEEKAKALIAAGYPADFNGEAYSTISGQNSNNSVRIPDKFMDAYLAGDSWQTTYRTSGEVADEYDAKMLMDKIAHAAWACADPGVQFDDTIQRWHTCKATDRIYASNPCSEYLFLDDSACNLASINLTKFLNSDSIFDIQGFRAAVRVFVTAMEIIVDLSSYPTQRIAQRSHEYRPLGLGFANLGALLMRLGIPYDSPAARAYAGAIAAIMSGHGYCTSAEIAKHIGPFAGYSKNRDSMLEVIRMHRDSAHEIDASVCPESLFEAAHKDWALALEKGERWGYRNAQISVIAPTGTIALFMDCDTTGIEPEFALVKVKKLAGGGSIKIVNQSVHAALEKLGYTSEETQGILTYLIGTGTLEGAPYINSESLARKGFTKEDIAVIEERLPSAFDLKAAFAPGLLGAACLDRLGITHEAVAVGDKENRCKENSSFEEEGISLQRSFAKEGISLSQGFSLLAAIGFKAHEITRAAVHICGTGTVEGAPYLLKKHYPVFDCAVPCGKKGTRYINHRGALDLMAAVQPFISGAISKTVNVPHDATVDDIKSLYVDAWRLGVKCLAVYRDGCKGSQPLSTGHEKGGKEGTSVRKEGTSLPQSAVKKSIPLNAPKNLLRCNTTKEVLEGRNAENEVSSSVETKNLRFQEFLYSSAHKTDETERGKDLPIRRRLPDKRAAVAHKFSVGGHEGYIHVGLYEDGTPGEVFLRMNKEGSVISGLMDTVATATSFALQYGVPLEFLVNKFSHVRFEPSGFTNNPDIPMAKSITDYVFRWLGNEFLSKDREETESIEELGQAMVQAGSDAPLCQECGALMVRSGVCYRCANCGSTSGCS